MYKRLKWSVAVVFLGIILVGCQMNSEQKSPKNETKTSKRVSHQKMTKKQQLAYLKEHEKELTEYVKTQNPDITDIKYDWNSIRTVEASNGTPQGGGKLLLIFGYANSSELTNFSLNFTLDDNQMPNIDSVGSDNLLMLSLNLRVTIV
ncbi:hypothetical protein [Streptococcus iniae]|uniref:hypothetical protein n=1 Tax=Streptococcus iniae TaxID=1346 RepID=UPI000EF76417|nr:hypothetical protein [Streptococcus iniae]RLU73777.1 hypothetical protein DIX95_08225 [Streptococcus iniae]RLV32700.1 hypothetical protein DIX48_10030 [Streptococcus iniae]